jgi:hypothetical protein
MGSKYEHLKDFDTRIRMIEKAAQELMRLAEQKEMPAVYRNAKRVLASAKILKLDISDILDFDL